MDDAYVEESFKDFGGFTSIEEEKDGVFVRVLGEPIKRELQNKEKIPKQTDGSIIFSNSFKLFPHRFEWDDRVPLTLSSSIGWIC